MTIPGPKTAALRGRSALVTGGAGFIGSHLVDALVASGARVRVLDDLSTGLRSNLDRSAASIDFVEGDLRRRADCRAACDGTEIVFHQAALGSVPRSLEDPATTLEVNVQGTANLLAAAREAGVARVVYASSSSVYGDSPEMPRREGHEGSPLSPYALSKQMTEAVAGIFWACYRLPVVGLRYFNVFGPRQRHEGPYAAVIPRFFDALLGGEAPLIFGDGEQTRDFTFVSDAVRANLLAAAAPDEVLGRAYNVGCGRSVSIRELAQRVQEALGLEREPKLAPPRPGDPRESLAELSRARRELGYEPRVALEAGLEACRSSHSKAGRREPAAT